MYSSGIFPIARTLQASLKASFRRQLCSQNINLTKYSVEELEGRGLIRVHGKEATTFLQGLVTNDMRHLEEGARSMYTMFLNIRGRVICDTIIYKDDNETFLIEADKEVQTTLQKHLKMYRVRKKMDIDVIDDLNVWVIFSKNLMEENNNKMPEINESDSEHDFILKTFQQSKIISRDPRLTELGYRLIASSDDDLLKGTKFSQPVEPPTKFYRQLRYQLGVGEGVAEMPPGKCIPLEVNCDFLHGVSFHKGCYIGQELTARVHHTGVVRKRLMPIILNSDPSDAFTLDASVENALDNKSVGKLRGLENRNGLALLKVSEALTAPALRLLSVTGFTKKPSWWPQEAPKERMTEKADILKMEQSTHSEQSPDDSGGTFTCYKCGLTEHYDFKGKKTPYSRWVVLNEDGYVMQDPFSTNRNEFLLLGSDCSICAKAICQSQNCSVYYMKRFCLPCAQTRLDTFPNAVLTRVKKYLAQN